MSRFLLLDSSLRNRDDYPRSTNFTIGHQQVFNTFNTRLLIDQNRSRTTSFTKRKQLVSLTSIIVPYDPPEDNSSPAVPTTSVPDAIPNISVPVGYPQPPRVVNTVFRYEPMLLVEIQSGDERDESLLASNNKAVFNKTFVVQQKGISPPFMTYENTTPGQYMVFDLTRDITFKVTNLYNQEVVYDDEAITFTDVEGNYKTVSNPLTSIRAVFKIEEDKVHTTT
jgi:hypothetical protein